MILQLRNIRLLTKSVHKQLPVRFNNTYSLQSQHSKKYDEIWKKKEKQLHKVIKKFYNIA